MIRSASISNFIFNELEEEVINGDFYELFDKAKNKVYSGFLLALLSDRNQKGELVGNLPLFRKLIKILPLSKIKTKELGIFAARITTNRQELPSDIRNLVFETTQSYRNAVILAAEQGGEGGRRKLRSLISAHPGLLSFICLQRAHQIATEENDTETASFIRAIQEERYPDTSQRKCQDPIDVLFLLKMTKNHSGYKALGDLPEKAGWKPLSGEELDTFLPPKNPYLDQFIKIPDNLPTYENVTTFFKDLKIISDDTPNPSLREIRQSEAELFYKLYLRIITGKTPIFFFNSNADNEFQIQLCGLFRTMMSTPSGRWLLLFSCRRESKFSIEKAQYCKTTSFNDIELSLSPFPSGSLNESGVIIPYAIGADGSLFHELCHLLHGEENPHLQQAMEERSSDPNYNYLEEQYAITGLPEDCNHLHLKGLCENIYHFERNAVAGGKEDHRARYGHKEFSLLQGKK